MRFAINGFGRIGRSAFKIALEKPEIEIVAINDLTNPRVLAHLLKYDSAYGVFDTPIYIEEDGKKVTLEEYKGEKDFFTTQGTENYLLIGNHKILITAIKEPKELPWGKLDIDVVLECTGRFVEDNSAYAHIEAGAKKVVVSAPTKGGDVKTFLIGANHEQYDDEQIISNASCTTNCISPVVKIIHNNFKITKSVMTTVHAMTAGQNVVDGPPKPIKPDLRAARAAGFNMIPTTTGAAKATTQVIPELVGLFDGISIRVPVLTGSLSDITMVVEKKTSVEEVNNLFIEEAKKPYYKGILKATYEPIVSSDIVGSTYSSIVDLGMTKVVDGDLIKVLSWYDNEWGYANRLVEMGMLVA